MRLFLTGATGFVGLNLLLEVLRSGRYGEIVVAVRDPDKLRKALEAEGFSRVSDVLRVIGWDEPPPRDVDHAVHCAGVLFARDRGSYFRVNVEDTLRLIGGLPRAARILVLSSQSAGGPTPVGRQARGLEDPDVPMTWYGESKLAMERALAERQPDAWIWRPPMILGPRDRATLPLFKMAAGPLRLKPGLGPKTYSWIAVSDLVASILTALDTPDWAPAGPLAVCNPAPITDLELIETAARVIGRRGRNLHLPHALLKAVSLAVDTVPALRTAAPSLTRDRVKEIFPDRWVVDHAPFTARFGGRSYASLDETLAETYAWYVRAGLLPA
ncbi:MAG TPA: NAD(P)-dependent oxidoreductase [Chthoniobacterales bacterium]